MRSKLPIIAPLRRLPYILMTSISWPCLWEGSLLIWDYWPMIYSPLFQRSQIPTVFDVWTGPWSFPITSCVTVWSIAPTYLMNACVHSKKNIKDQRFVTLFVMVSQRNLNVALLLYPTSMLILLNNGYICWTATFLLRDGLQMPWASDVRTNDGIERWQNLPLELSYLRLQVICLTFVCSSLAVDVGILVSCVIVSVVPSVFIRYFE